MATARRKATGSARQRAADNRSTPGCSLSGRSAGILYPLAGRRRSAGRGATMATARRKATGSARQRAAKTAVDPPGCSLSPAARPAFFIRWRAAEESAGRGATMATARRKATGSARQRAATTAGWISPLAALSPAARPAFFIRWRAAEESAGRGATMATARRKATGSARQRAADNRRLDPPGCSLSPAARPAFFIRWRAAEESAGRGATMATARRKATGSARQRAADNRRLDIPLAALSPAARPAFFIRWRAAEESAGRGATMATARRKATGSARQRAATTAG